MSRHVAPYGRSYIPPLEIGQEWWTSTPHLLAARVRRGEQTGRVRELLRMELAPGLHGSLIQRLRPEPRLSPTQLGAGVAIAGGSLAVLLLLYVAAVTVQALILVWPILAVLAALYGGLRLMTGHRPHCAGLHCGGCRG